MPCGLERLVNGSGQGPLDQPNSVWVTGWYPVDSNYRLRWVADDVEVQSGRTDVCGGLCTLFLLPSFLLIVFILCGDCDDTIRKQMCAVCVTLGLLSVLSSIHLIYFSVRALFIIRLTFKSQSPFYLAD